MCFFVVLCAIGVVVCGNIVSAEQDWRYGDMRIEYHRKFSRCAAVSIKGRAVMMPGADQEGQRTLYDTASECLLEGYYFLPGILGNDRYDPALRKQRVREFICAKQSFFSEMLQRCLLQVADGLDAGGSAYCSADPLKKLLTADAIRKHVCPRGTARRWSVVARESVKKHMFEDKVFLLFQGEDDALEGVLCAEEQSEEKHPSLLDMKNVPQPQVPLQIILKTPPSVEELIATHGYAGGYNLGIIYFTQAGEQHRALTNMSCIFTEVEYLSGENVYVESLSLLSFVKMQILKGYSLKQDARPSAEPSLVDIEVMQQKPCVRQVACDRQVFESNFLCSFLKDSKNILMNAKYTLRENHPFWGGLCAQDCEECGQNKKFEWSILEQCELENVLSVEAVCAGTVLFLPKGETIALCGKPVSSIGSLFPRDRTLFAYFVQKTLQECHALAEEYNPLWRLIPLSNGTSIPDRKD